VREILRCHASASCPSAAGRTKTNQSPPSIRATLPISINNRQVVRRNKTPERHLQPSRVALHLARLHELARFHLELTAPGVSGGQVLPHNGDRSLVVPWSNRALRAVRSEREREPKEKKGPRRHQRPTLLSSDLGCRSKSAPVLRLWRMRLHASRCCFPPR